MFDLGVSRLIGRGGCGVPVAQLKKNKIELKIRFKNNDGFDLHSRS